MRPALTDAEKQAWRDLLEGVLDGDNEIPQHLAPIHPEDGE